jgi:hypothetical protein
MYIYVHNDFLFPPSEPQSIPTTKFSKLSALVYLLYKVTIWRITGSGCPLSLLGSGSYARPSLALKLHLGLGFRV